jgi:hypothetical protein
MVRFAKADEGFGEMWRRAQDGLRKNKLVRKNISEKCAAGPPIAHWPPSLADIYTQAGSLTVLVLRALVGWTIPNRKFCGRIIHVANSPGSWPRP